PIVASGANACVLHYIDNNQVCKEGELILMDVGASYANYAADMTRCIPVSGRFSERQKAVYEAVLRVMNHALSELKVGNNLQDYHASVGEAMTKELVDLKLLTQEEVKAQNPKHPAYKKYFMHGTSHHLGLDVHDVGDKYRTFEEGMVFTCEPGIYIKEEGLGIRLENDVVIRKGGIEDLMQNIPLETEVIEELMNQ
ncbi:MAG: M24 family metallopeptidase, partial [Bacteroidota bacterium]